MLRYLILALCLITLNVNAVTKNEKGLQIAKEADRRDQGFVDTFAKMNMVLRNRQGNTAVRELTVKVLEGNRDGDKNLIIFHHPKDVKGTALLTYSHKFDDDDQWLYMPAIKRVKRIASRNQSGPFMGSEFAYEDLTPQQVEKYTYEYVREEKLNGLDCFVVIRYPVNRLSGYKKQIAWIDKNEYRIQKMEFYDRKNSRVKTMMATDYKKYLGKYWRAHNLHMTNHQTGKSTTLMWSNFKFNNGYSNRDFNQSTLRRAR